MGTVELEASWRAEHGAVEAVVTATATDDDDHAFDLVVALPVEATSWRWLDDWATARAIVEPIRYAMTASADMAGWLPVSIYPYGGITDGASGLAAAVPLDLAVPAVIEYDAASELLEVRWHLALAPQTGHGTVTVSARFFAFDPSWGFRSIIARYHDTWRDHTRWFQSSFDPSPFESFHTNNYWGEFGARRCAAEEAEKVLSVQYTVPDFVVDRVCQGGEVPPDFAGLLDLIQSRGEQGSGCDQYYDTALTGELSRDATGAPVLKYMGVRPWTGGWVQAVLKITPLAGEDEDGYWTWLSQCHLLPAFESTATPDPAWNPPVPPSTVDGVLLDNFGAHLTGDLDGEHLRAASGALTYSPADDRPAVFLPAAYRAHMERLRRLLDTLPPPLRAIVINWKGLGTVNADLPLADLCADETDDFFAGDALGSGSANDYAPWLVRSRRALAYGKLRATAFAGSGITRQDVEHTLAYTLLWGTAARFKDETVFDGISAEEADSLARAHNRLVADLQRAGWEPLTGARTSNPNLLVERYGSPPQPFFLVVTNVSGQPVDGSVRLDPSLGVAAIERITERTRGAAVEIGGRSPAWTLGFRDLGSFDTLLLEIVPSPRTPHRPSGRALPGS
ncbi:MAG TPA: hypothetical protein ENK19_08550 [Acidobacteria bacterium]|nr:hypothetical protein [Acidobacteriota bacterium]